MITHLRTQKTALLLAYLAYYPNRPHLRSALTELLRPDSTMDAARANLSNALSWLRRQFHGQPGDAASIDGQRETGPFASPPFILADHAFVQLDPDRFTTDVAEFAAAFRYAAGAAPARP